MNRVPPEILPRQTPAPVALRATGLTKLYGSTVALWAVDLAVRAGEALTVRGPNASGKSTLLRILAGLTPPTRGTVGWISEPSDRVARVAFVGHETHLWDALTVWENIRLHAQLGRADPARAEGPLGRLGLAGNVGSPAGSLSSGVRRRVAIARALVVDPDVLVLDEPFASLDDGAAELVADELRRQRDDGRMLVLASHEFGRTSTVETRTIWLEAGRVLPDRRGMSQPSATMP